MTTTSYPEAPPVTACPPCPAWCSLPEGHDWPLFDEGDVRGHHPLPLFGLFEIVANEEYVQVENPVAWVESSRPLVCEDLGPAELRAVAAQALAAAEWLEAHTV